MNIDYLAVIKSRVKQWERDHIKQISEKIDDAFCCKWHGIPTWHLRCELGYPTSLHRAALKKLEKEGKVIYHKQSENQLLWWPVGFLEEIVKP